MPPEASAANMGGSSSKVADVPANTGGTTASKEEDNDPKVDYLKLYSQADRTDYLLMAVGTFGALCNGARWGLNLRNVRSK